jgi:hypothetical protein
MTIKRYLVFAGPRYYPEGGWGDFRNAYDTLEEAIAFSSLMPTADYWTHIIDLQGLCEIQGLPNRPVEEDRS